MKRIHLMYVPFTGLGLYGGFRGNRWLRNRIEIFKEYTCRSLLAQTNQDFILWVSWRPQEKNNPQVIELYKWCLHKFGFDGVVFTFSGLCFWDDKYPDDQARNRLVNSLHRTMSELVNYITEDEVLMTIQPSDDCYHSLFIQRINDFFDNNPDYNAVGYQGGYIMNYQTKEISEYNPNTNPPFFTIKFPKSVFIDPYKHMKYTGPYKSHEHIPDFTKYYRYSWRGFIVGCHGENISTYYDHPFKGENIDNPSNVQDEFGLLGAPDLKFKVGWRRWVLKKIPHPIRRKLRYWFNEKLYEFLRS